jgi:hypothetical protein
MSRFPNIQNCRFKQRKQKEQDKMKEETEAKIRAITDLIDSGMTMTKACKKMGINSSNYSRYRKQLAALDKASVYASEVPKPNLLPPEQCHSLIFEDGEVPGFVSRVVSSNLGKDDKLKILAAAL